ncbi:MAG: hypothetical protein RBT44_03020 [Sphaerochaetaceae bacterium]|jgi:hypothetical protein|nr:hypothetical protein [Sphaerochaetaceae bacterium]
MKRPRLVHAVLRAIVLLSCLPALLWAAEGSFDPSSDSLVLLFSDITTATAGELRMRAQFSGIDDTGSEEQLRDRLLAYHKIIPTEMKSWKEREPQGEEVRITRASRIYVQGSGSRFILLEGDVEMVLVPSDPTYGELNIAARTVVVDLERKTVSALGSVRYRNVLEKSEDILEGEILTVWWESGRLLLSDGGTSMMRSNSEEQEVRFFTSGSTVSISGDPRTISYEDGFITTNREQAYFSIAASSVHMVEGGDLFVTNAKIQLGRVPMLWLPFFYYPGRTFVFNPSFGIDSERGWFFSTTTELYGSYPKMEKGESNSLTTLLSDNSDAGERQRDGWVYGSGVASSNLESWARKNESYLVLLADAYRNRGIFLGLDTQNKLLSKQLTLTGFGGVAFPGSQGPSLSTVYGIEPVRYGFDGSVQVNAKALRLSLQMGMFSDPRFLRDYGNRLTSFSVGALTRDPAWPTTYRSDISTFDWLLNATSTIPMKGLAPFVESVRIDRLTARVTWKALTMSEGSGYRVSALTLPDLGLSVSGKLLRLNTAASQESKMKVTQEIADPAIKLDAWGIQGPYGETAKARTTVSPITNSSLEFSYSVRQDYRQNSTVDADGTVESSRYARNASSVTIQGAIAPSVLSFTQRLDPLYTVNEGEGTETSQLTLTSLTDLSLPYVGLSYGLTSRLYQGKRTDGNETGGWGSWGKDSVGRHQVTWKKSLSTGTGVLTPSFTTTLPPIDISLLPKLEYAQGNIAASASYKVKQLPDDTFTGEDATVKFSYIDKGEIEFSATGTYDTSAITGSTGILDPLVVDTSLSIHPFDGFLSVRESASYDFSGMRFDRFSLSAGIPWVTASIHGSGPIDDPVWDLLDTKVQVEAFERRWWKNRISLALDLSVSYRHSFWDMSASDFTFKIDLSFNIAEFLSLEVALTTVNKGLHRYRTFSDLWDDLLASFDFFGDGRNETQFTMEAVEISLVHHMADWDLHCKYHGSVVLSDLEWRWKPVFTVLLQWKAIPEIKVDREFDAGR